MAYKVIDIDGTPKKTNGEESFGSLLSDWSIEKKSFSVDDIGNRSFQAVASTSKLDRDGDIILQEGFQWAKKSNGQPAVSGQFGHNYNTVPVYRVTNLRVERDALRFIPVFPPEGKSEFADEVYEAYADERLYGFSVGFRPIEWSYMTVGKLRDMGLLDLVGEVAADVPDDTWLSGIIFEKQELMEISCVPVPANPEAQILRSFGASQFVKSSSGLLVPKGMFTEVNKESEKKVKFYYHIPPVLEDKPIAEKTEEIKITKKEETEVTETGTEPIEEKNKDNEISLDVILAEIKVLKEGLEKALNYIKEQTASEETIPELDPSKKATDELANKIRLALSTAKNVDEEVEENKQPDAESLMSALKEAMTEIKDTKKAAEKELHTSLIDAIKDLQKTSLSDLQGKFA